MDVFRMTSKWDHINLYSFYINFHYSRLLEEAANIYHGTEKSRGENIREIQQDYPKNYMQALEAVLLVRARENQEVRHLEDVEIQVFDFTKIILGENEWLAKCVGDHWQQIFNGWSLLSFAQRQKIIHEGFGDIPALRNPDEVEFRKLPAKFPDQDAPFLSPNINIEGLCERSNMLLLMKARAERKPHLFAYADIRAAKLGFKSFCVIPPRIQGPRGKNDTNFSMIFESSSHGEFGKIIRMRSKKDVEDVISGITLDAGLGWKLLRAQKNLYKGLHKTAELILKEASKLEKAAIYMDSKLHQSEERQQTSLSTLASESLYAFRDSMDLAQIQSWVDVKVRALEDHIDAFSTNPAYYREAMREYWDHDNDRLPLVKIFPGRVIQCDTKPLDGENWSQYLHILNAEAYIAHNKWCILQKCVEDLASIGENYPNFTGMKALPLLYEMAYLKAKVAAERVEQFLQPLIGSYMRASPPFRNEFQIELEQDGKNKVQLRPQGTGGHFNPISVRISQMVEDDWRSSLICSEVQAIFEDPSQSAKITPFIARLLSDLSMITHIRTILETFEPWSTLSQPRMITLAQKLVQNYQNQSMPFLTQVKTAFKDVKPVHIEKPTEERFPSSTSLVFKEHRDGLSEGEQNLHSDLQRFSAQAMANLKKANLTDCEFSLRFQSASNRLSERNDLPVMAPEKDNKLLDSLGNLSLGSSVGVPKYPKDIDQEPTKLASPNKIPKPEKNPLEKPGSTSTNISPPRIPHSTSPTRTQWSPMKRASKEKTKGKDTPTPTQDHPMGINPAVNDDPYIVDEPVKIKIDRRAMDLFESIMHHPGSRKQLSYVEWSDLCHALRAAGFDQMMTMSGSARHFSSTTLEYSIVIHEPHYPHRSKMPINWAMGVGRQLRDRLGWTLDSFTVG